MEILKIAILGNPLAKQLLSKVADTNTNGLFFDVATVDNGVNLPYPRTVTRSFINALKADGIGYKLGRVGVDYANGKNRRDGLKYDIRLNIENVFVDSMYSHGMFKLN